jgi:hypothetical protein
MLRKLWNWITEEDYRERYPNGDLVNKALFPGGWLDVFPLWLQRLAGLFLLFAIVVLCLLAWIAPELLERAGERLQELFSGKG